MKLTNKLAAAFLAVALAVAGLTTTVVAQEFSESHIAAAKRAMNASRSTDRLDTILPQMAASAKAELIRDRPDREQELTAVVDNAALALASRRGDLENEVAQVFAKVFTEEELVVIADFYESEAGKKFLKESPIVIREMTQASRVWSNGLRRDLSDEIRKGLEAAGLTE